MFTGKDKSGQTLLHWLLKKQSCLHNGNDIYKLSLLGTVAYFYFWESKAISEILHLMPPARPAGAVFLKKKILSETRILSI